LGAAYGPPLPAGEGGVRGKATLEQLDDF